MPIERQLIVCLQVDHAKKPQSHLWSLENESLRLEFAFWAGMNCSAFPVFQCLLPILSWSHVVGFLEFGIEESLVGIAALRGDLFDRQIWTFKQHPLDLFEFKTRDMLRIRKAGLFFEKTGQIDLVNMQINGHLLEGAVEEILFHILQSPQNNLVRR